MLCSSLGTNHNSAKVQKQLLGFGALTFLNRVHLSNSPEEEVQILFGTLVFPHVSESMSQ